LQSGFLTQDFYNDKFYFLTQLMDACKEELTGELSEAEANVRFEFLTVVYDELKRHVVGVYICVKFMCK